MSRSVVIVTVPLLSGIIGLPGPKVVLLDGANVSDDGVLFPYSRAATNQRAPNKRAPKIITQMSDAVGYLAPKVA